MKTWLGYAALGALIALVALLAPAAQRTFVAAGGLDTNLCTIDSPCRSFAAAIAHTNYRGEVIVLDSAGYGPVTISQAVSIVAPPGVYAGITVFTGNGVTVSAGAGADVVLRGLTLNAQPPSAAFGIHVVSAGVVRVENCVIDGFLNGIFFEPSTVTGISVVDSTVRHSGSAGIVIQPKAGGEQSWAEISRTTSTRNIFAGLSLLDVADVSIADSTFSSNGLGLYVRSDSTTTHVAIRTSGFVLNLAGVSGVGTGGHTAAISISRSVISSNGTNVVVTANSGVFLDANQITTATSDSVVAQGTAAIFSMRNNAMDVIGVATSTATQLIAPY